MFIRKLSEAATQQIQSKKQRRDCSGRPLKENVATKEGVTAALNLDNEELELPSQFETQLQHREWKSYKLESAAVSLDSETLEQCQDTGGSFEVDNCSDTCRRSISSAGNGAQTFSEENPAFSFIRRNKCSQRKAPIENQTRAVEVVLSSKTALRSRIKYESQSAT